MDEIIRFELKDATLAVGSVVGNPFELVAYLGSLDWDAKEGFSLKPDGTPPAVIAIAYADADVAGYNESLLQLYRLGSSGWEEATCPGYDLIRFPADNRLVVPICQTSTFVLNDQQPVMQRFIYLPAVSR